MRFSDSHRMVFIHVQKTGGSTIDAMLDREIPDVRGLKGVIRHATLATVLRKAPELSRYWTFAFVRNPWDRQVSWWAMVRDVLDKVEAGDEAAARRVAKNPNFWVPVAEYDSFEEYLRRGFEEVPRLALPQTRFVDSGHRRADFVGRQETFAADLAAVRARLGLKRLRRIPRDNVSPHRPYQDYYTDATRDLVGQVFARDVAAFDYRF